MALYDPDYSKNRQKEISNIVYVCTDYLDALKDKDKLDELYFLKDVMIHLDEWKSIFDLIQRLAKKGIDLSKSY